jgi:toxin ParE1/3/4
MWGQLQYVAVDNPAAATRMELAIEDQTDMLKDYPNMGRLGRSPNTRELVVTRTPYIAVYRVQKTSVEIVRLLHGAQHWP